FRFALLVIAFNELSFLCRGQLSSLKAMTRRAKRKQWFRNFRPFCQTVIRILREKYRWGVVPYWGAIALCLELWKKNCRKMGCHSIRSSPRLGIKVNLTLLNNSN